MLDKKMFEIRHDFWDLLLILKIYCNKIINGKLVEYNLSELELSVLISVYYKTKISIKDMIKKLNTNQGNTSNACKILEKKGLLIRSISNYDGRSTDLCLSTIGENIMNEIFNVFSSGLKVKERLSLSEVYTFHELIKKVYRIIEVTLNGEKNYVRTE